MRFPLIAEIRWVCLSEKNKTGKEMRGGLYGATQAALASTHLLYQTLFVVSQDGWTRKRWRGLLGG